MRTGLQKLKGVEDVQVSLEKGTATLEMKPDNKVTLQEIQSVVEKNGFSPIGARVKLKGVAQEKQITVSKSNEAIEADFKIDRPSETTKEVLMEGDVVIPEDDGERKVTITKIE